MMMKEYRQLEGTTRVETLGMELAQVLQSAALDARFDFQCALEVRPATHPNLNHLGSDVHWVDYRILLDEVGKRHEEAGVIKRASGASGAVILDGGR
jgi:hypothetical protein